jgi:hypothetical protein
MVRAITLLSILSLPAWTENAPVSEASASAIIGALMPAFYNGYLYSRAPDNTVTLFAPDGHCVLNLVIEGRGNGRVSVESVAIDTDGTLAVGWVDAPNAGIDIRDPLGKLVRSIDTGIYLPMHLSFGDHSLWAFGWQRDADKEWGFPANDYQTVRKYSMDGKLIGSYLPRSLFPPGLEPSEQGWQERRITVTGDRVGVEATSGKSGDQREWVELGLNGDLLGRWKLNSSDKFPGVAFTADNHVYVHRFDRETKSRRVFRLNKGKSTWEAVNAPNAELYGADGDKLVFAQWSDGVMHLSWYQQP